MALLLLDLPDEILELVVLRLAENPADILLRLALTCRALYRLCTADALWRRLCVAIGAVDDDVGADEAPHPTGFWLECFRHANTSFRFEDPAALAPGSAAFELSADRTSVFLPGMGPRLIALERGQRSAQHQYVCFNLLGAENVNVAFGVVHESALQGPSRQENLLVARQLPDDDSDAERTEQDCTLVASFQNYAFLFENLAHDFVLPNKKVAQSPIVALHADFVKHRLEVRFGPDGLYSSSVPCRIPAHAARFAFCPYYLGRINLLPVTAAVRAWFRDPPPAHPDAVDAASAD